ncbi:Oxidoreductase family, NAD-binding Rossmann fold [Roseimaritima multifibrata]|uniref:Oxidoreductase family, NAD-binding Rossmann fold n=2 Tax=Roseimaritima multifibrata TaxID=1930274 RepID=A0A517MLR2_9BACT|nr:Oxidoreductase family, NAD-binding Rossmann fold [Roseimaritima multifibrata]
MQECAIVGAGQIGSRHLQALSRLKSPLRICVVDPSPQALQRSRLQFEEFQGKSDTHQVSFETSAENLPPKLDLAIIATVASHRLSAMDALFKRSALKYLILEKFLFQSTDDYHKADSLLAQTSTQTWVNCPRRLWSFYQRLRERLTGSKVHYHVTGSQWGLGCNAIHFIDHLAFLTGDNHYSILDASLEVDPSPKRQGTIEFTGSLLGKLEQGSTFEITSLAKPGHPIEVSILADEVEFHINETKGTGWSRDLAPTLERVDLDFKIPYVSETGAIACQDILSHGNCDLTTYEDSVALHTPLLQTFLKYYQTQIDETATACPIT